MSATRSTPALDPFSSGRIDEIPLASAPLVRVLAQARFDQLSIFMRDEPLIPFVRKLEDVYKHIEIGQGVQFIVEAGGVSQKPASSKLWRLRTPDKKWAVTVTSESLALETSAYESRDAFIRRFEEVVDAFSETINPLTSTRLGIRYTNQITGKTFGEGELLDLQKLMTFINPDARSGLAIPLPKEVRLQHSFNDSLFVLNDSSVQARWGLLPAGTIFDPELPPVSIPSWFLDLDSFTSNVQEFSAEAIGRQLRHLADQAYRLFRWLTTEEFIEHFKEG